VKGGAQVYADGTRGSTSKGKRSPTSCASRTILSSTLGSQICSTSPLCHVLRMPALGSSDLTGSAPADKPGQAQTSSFTLARAKRAANICLAQVGKVPIYSPCANEGTFVVSSWRQLQLIRGRCPGAGDPAGGRRGRFSGRTMRVHGVKACEGPRLKAWRPGLRLRDVWPSRRAALTRAGGRCRTPLKWRTGRAARAGGGCRGRRLEVGTHSGEAVAV